ncbi:hypothetical protein V7S43_013451 [Phytophthora oleae]|uniref:Uncharacterized protein n=1 Tax=Phytophthora oleae TaxID=2107226 RepID=A0ABD3F5D8_9STRA
MSSTAAEPPTSAKRSRYGFVVDLIKASGRVLAQILFSSDTSLGQRSKDRLDVVSFGTGECCGCTGATGGGWLDMGIHCLLCER